jgi:hypothetical protein
VHLARNVCFYLDENIINLSAVSGFFLGFQTCFKVYIQKGSGSTAWINNRIGNVTFYLAKKTGGYEYCNTSDK